MFILQNPNSFLQMLTNTLKTQKDYYQKTYIGLLGIHDTYLPDFAYQTYLLFICGISLFDHNREFNLKIVPKIGIILIWLSIYISIFILLFFSWTSSNSNLIEGVQGRYFIPLGVLPYMLFYNRTVPSRKNFLFGITFLYLVAILIMMTIRIFGRYYIQGYPL